MKHCVAITCLLALARAASASSAAPSEVRVFIGVYTKTGSQGIYMSRLNLASGELTPPELAAKSSSPSFLAMHPKAPFLYAVNEDSGRVSAYRIEPDSGKLTLLNQLESGGAGPCHLAVDATGKMLVVANYGGGSVASFSISPNGRLGTRTQLIQFRGSGPDKRRQEAPHAHSTTIAAENRLLLVNDLGTDRTMIYHLRAETASLEANTPPFAKAEPGAGPRHLAIDKSGRFVYVLNEIASSITQFSFEARSGALRFLGTVSALPAEFHGANTSAEIALNRSGKTLYASNRGSDSISVFNVDGLSGTLRLKQNVPSGGKTPRHFALDPSGRWLIAANQDSGNLTVFRVAEQTGKLVSRGVAISVNSPVCVLFQTDDSK